MAGKGRRPGDRATTLRVAPAPSPGELENRVREALENLELKPEDAGVQAIALQYARTVDEARELAEAAAQMPYDPDTAVMVARLRQRVEAHTVMADLGPKLLAALESLGASPKARAVLGKRPPPGVKASKLHQMRGGATA